MTDNLVSPIQLVSAAADGTVGNGTAIFSPVFSPDGSKIAFSSSASNLVHGDTNEAVDVFIKDLATGAVTRVTTNSVGEQADGDSLHAPAFSPDGTRIVFASYASNLVDQDVNGNADVFVKDLITGSVTLVSTGAFGGQSNSNAYNPTFSPDGTKVLFASGASNLVAGDTNDCDDVFIKDLATGAISRLSTDASGAQASSYSWGPVFSPDGSKIAFSSPASNLIPGDTNGTDDIFVKDLATGAITRVTTDANGGQSDSYSYYAPVFSPNGTQIAFGSNASNLVPGDTNGTTDVFVKDLTSGNIVRVSTDASGGQANGYSYYSPVFSPDGSKIAFVSGANNLVSGDGNNGSYDVFIKDLATGAIARVSTGASGEQANGGSYHSPTFSADGSKIAFLSDASNLGFGDTNQQVDVFIKDVTGLFSNAVLPKFYVDNATTVEGAPIRFLVTLSSLAGAGGVTFDYAITYDTASPEDIILGSGSGSIAAGDNFGSVDIATVLDGFADNSESLSIRITNINGATIEDGYGVGYIFDPSFLPTLTVADAQAMEGGNLVFTITLSTPAGAQGVSVPYGTSLYSAGGATAQDFSGVSGALHFSPGEHQKTIIIPTFADGLAESTETMILWLPGYGSNVIVINGMATGTILDAPPPLPTVSISDATTTEGGDFLFTGTLSEAVTSDVVVTVQFSAGTASAADYASDNLGDYSAEEGSTYQFTIYAGNTTGGFTMGTVDDLTFEPSESMTVSVTSVTGATIADGTATGTILDNDAPPPPPLLSTDEAFEAAGGKLMLLGTLARAAYALQGPDEQTGERINSISPSAEALLTKSREWLRPLTPQDLTSLMPVSAGSAEFPARGLSDLGIYTNENAAVSISRTSDALFVAFRGTNDFGISDQAMISAMATLAIGGVNAVTAAIAAVEIYLGASSDMRDWINLSRHFELYASALSAIRDYAADDANGITKIYLTGHSLGAAMVQPALSNLETQLGFQGIALEGVTFASPGYGSNPGKTEFYGGLDNPSQPITNFWNYTDPITKAANLQVIDGAQISISDNFGGWNSGNVTLSHDMNLYLEEMKLLSTEGLTLEALDRGINGVAYDSISLQVRIVTDSDGANDTPADRIFVGGNGASHVIAGDTNDVIIHVGDLDDVIYAGVQEYLLSTLIDLVPHVGTLKTGVSALRGAMAAFSGDPAGVSAQAVAVSLATVREAFRLIDAAFISVSTGMALAANDVVLGGGGDDYLNGLGGQNLVYGGSGNDQLVSWGGNDNLYGGSEDDTLNSGDGSDRLEGGEGDDILQPGGGNDHVLGGRGKDLISLIDINNNLVVSSDIFDGGEGIDTLDLSELWIELGTVRQNFVDLTSGQAVTFYAGIDSIANIENVIGSRDADDISGNTLANVLYGGDRNDFLRGMGASDGLLGGNGKDTLDGGEGRDRLNGGANDDIYIVDNVGDQTFESANGGTDTVRSTVSLVNSAALAAFVENIILLETGDAARNNLWATGNTLANRITGNAGNNTLNGGADGVADTLAGAAGNDIYYAGAADIIVEGAGEGTADRVKAYQSFKLSSDDYVEYLETADASATATIGLTGNSFEQTITGNAGVNIISGSGGQDNLTGGGGHDRFVYKTASDSVVGAERDIIRDFTTAGTLERIDLSAFLGTFTFRGTDSFNSVFREVSYSYVGGNTLVKIDLDFDAASEMEILLIGRHALTAGDFIL